MKIPIEIQQITLAHVEWNGWNGFFFSIFRVEISTEKDGGFDGELFGIHIGTRHLIIYLAFIEFEIKSPFC